MMLRASSSISALNTNLSFSATARAAAGRAEISSTSRFTLGIFREGFLAEHERHQPRPAPQRHVDDGVGVADHVAALGEMIVENAVMTLGLELVAVAGVFQILSGRGVLEMHRLARIGTDAAGDEHQP